MGRIDKSALTKIEIIQEASKQFLEKGYTHTTISAISKELAMSPGNLTFHFPTKDYMLAKLVDMLCKFQWKKIEEEADEGISSVMAICLELAVMAGVCEEDEVIRDFILSSYTSSVCLNIIRRNDASRAKEVFKDYCQDWTEKQFIGAEIVVSGIEYALMMPTDVTLPLEERISYALHSILEVYGVPEEIRNKKLQKVFNMDYRSLGRKVFDEFKEYVAKANEDAFRALLHI